MHASCLCESKYLTKSKKNSQWTPVSPNNGKDDKTIIRQSQQPVLLRTFQMCSNTHNSPYATRANIGVVQSVGRLSLGCNMDSTTGLPPVWDILLCFDVDTR